MRCCSYPPTINRKGDDYTILKHIQSSMLYIIRTNKTRSGQEVDLESKQFKILILQYYSYKN